VSSIVVPTWFRTDISADGMIHIWSLDGRVIQGKIKGDTHILLVLIPQSLTVRRQPTFKTALVSTTTQQVPTLQTRPRVDPSPLMRTATGHLIASETYHGTDTNLPSCRHAGKSKGEIGTAVPWRSTNGKASAREACGTWKIGSRRQRRSWRRLLKLYIV
jgi:hypothetical protein